ncbi:MAG TPA: alpha/beta fold hydrolase [Syntrophales bacterium]|nr:alpha/beta fold hydrolase [Syntrophales bacterium]
MVKILLVAILGFLVSCGLFYFRQENMIFYPEILPPDFQYKFPTQFDEVNLNVEGAVINALHFKADAPKGVIIYFHGNAGNLRGWGEVALDFTRLNYDILIMDYRGYGKSTGKIESEAMLHSDAAVAYGHLRVSYPEDQIVIYGRSIGTGIAVHLARENKPRMVILESPMFNMQDLAKYHYPLIPAKLISSLLKYPMQTNLWIGDLRCPVYLFHGKADDIVPHNSSERLIKLIKTEGRLITLPGGGHNNLDAFQQYHEELARILK